MRHTSCIPESCKPHARIPHPACCAAPMTVDDSVNAGIAKAEHGAMVSVPPVSNITECLRVGSWEPRTPANLSAVPSDAPYGRSSSGIFDCSKEHTILRQRWFGKGKACAGALADALNSGFFASGPPVQLMFLGDSLVMQLFHAVEVLMLVNPYLRGLHVSAAQKMNFLPPSGVLTPSHATVCGRCLLERIVKWPPLPAHTSGPPARVLVVGFGTWYNILRGRRKEMSKETDTKTCPTMQLGRVVDKRTPMNSHACSNQTDQLHPKTWDHLQLGNALLTSPEAYTSDLESFLEALQQWTRGGGSGRDVHVVWAEAPPQHWPQPSWLSPGTSDATVQANGCSVKAVPFLPDSLCDGAPPMSELTARTLAALARGGGCSSRLNSSVQLWEQVLLHCFEHTLHDWRNLIAGPLLAHYSVPVVPLSAALRHRGDQHKGPKYHGTNRAQSALKDCTHWCDRSEATVFQAEATLNVVRSLLAHANS